MVRMRGKVSVSFAIAVLQGEIIAQPAMGGNIDNARWQPSMWLPCFWL